MYRKIFGLLVLVLFSMPAADVQAQNQRGPKVGGSGTPDCIPKWTASTTLGDSVVCQTDGNIEVLDNVGIGVLPASRLHIESALDTVGTIFELPSNPGIPPGGDPTYRHKAIMQWRGGEEKFGKWRNYFNAFEQDWALTYNAPWDYTNNHWLGRDSGDPRANIAAFLRFDVAEGNSGANTFEIIFAPPADAGVPPDLNAAAHLNFWDGRITPSPARPARFRIWGPANMDAVLNLTGNGTVDPLSMELRSDGVDKLFAIGQVNRDGIGDVISETNFLAVKTDTGNVGVGTTNPAATLHVVGNFIATGSKSGVVETASYGKRLVYAVESPENWIEDFGTAELIKGRAVVTFDPIFAESANMGEYHVFITPKGDCTGIYVEKQDTSSFEVRELKKGRSNIAFDYRIVARRRGYERVRLAELKDTKETRATASETPRPQR